ncbi:hypothetical protein FB45DRAFT_1033976 [Roridomyces roridus]|uniref:Cyanovirin-N domain-containing protein n=1 Tax=Roridomyces roridus TaxID=1738132 RepID=A0AAD7BDC9_9AGAR|nr:hypothetical protein FB45DRAFT_1033976 [Roridomyces roridus]
MFARLTSVLMPLALLASMTANATPVELQRRNDSITSVCTQIVLIGGSTLQGTCRPAPGQGEAISTINLNLCVGERNGDLVAGGGGFVSPGNCDVSGLFLGPIDQFILNANCTSVSGFKIGSQLHLDQAIVSNGGSLACA